MLPWNIILGKQEMDKINCDCEKELLFFRTKNKRR